MFLPQTELENSSEAQLLIMDGHSSHTSEMLVATYYLNNVYLLSLPAHTSHILQPLDLGCFSNLIAAYRGFLGDPIALTDKTKLGKARFLKIRFGVAKAVSESSAFDPDGSQLSYTS